MQSIILPNRRKDKKRVKRQNMRLNTIHSDSGVNKLLGQLGANKKKTAMALCLIGVMLFMWIRVLGGDSPESAEATMTTALVTEKPPNVPTKIIFVELPNVRGRNDVLRRDFFSINEKWLSDKENINVVSSGKDEEYIKKITKRIKLTAIELGSNPQAFINDKLLVVGDRLLVDGGDNTYECVVVEIAKNKVVMKCAEAELTLKLSRESEVTN